MTSAEATARALLARATPRVFQLAGGVEIAALDWGGDGPLALLHHANGFCKGTWALVADALRPRWCVVAIDARGHGDSSKPEGPGAYLWHRFADDLIGVADQLAVERGQPIALGIGNSFGGTALLGASGQRPELFERLLLADAVIPRLVDPSLPLDHQPHVRRLVDGARRRRHHWPSRAAAREWCTGRSLFAGWRPDAIELYLLDGMHERPGGDLELKCPGEVEAAIFAGSGSVDAFALAGAVRVPTRFLHAARGDFPRPVYEAIAASMPDATVETLDSGHLVPMEHPELIAAAVTS